RVGQVVLVVDAGLDLVGAEEEAALPLDGVTLRLVVLAEAADRAEAVRGLRIVRVDVVVDDAHGARARAGHGVPVLVARVAHVEEAAGAEELRRADREVGRADLAGADLSERVLRG